MGVNKVIYSNTTLIDLTGDTVTADTLAEGMTAHDKRGEKIVGKMVALNNEENNTVVTTFPTDGSVMEYHDDGSTLQTIFNEDDSITEITTQNSETKTKQTTFTDFGVIEMYTDDGNQIHYGETEPDTSVGIDGDVFLRREKIMNYTRVKNIRSSGAEYIDTNYRPSGGKLQIELKFRYTASHNGLSLFGNATNAPFAITVYGSKPVFYVGTSNSLSCGPQTALNTDYILKVTAENGRLTAVWNGVTYTATYSGALNTATNMFIFGSNSNGTLKESDQGYQLEYFKIWDNNILVRDYIPLMDDKQTVFLYDRVTKLFSYNKGSGAFVAGETMLDETLFDELGEYKFVAMYMKINGVWTLLSEVE